MEKKVSFFYGVIEKVASLKLFFIISILLSIHFYLAVIAVKGGIDPGFKKLNQFILIDWVNKLGPDHSIILGWLIFALVFVSIFGLNIVARVILEIKNLYALFRSYSDSKKDVSKNFILKKTSVFIIHFSIVLMIFIHLLSSVTGTKFMGPVIEKGKIVKHKKLEFPIEVVDIKKSGTKFSKPLILLKNASDENAKVFQIPGWHKGTYYDVKAAYVNSVVKTKTGEKKIKRIGLKLFVHSLNVVSFLIFTSIFCLTGFFLHMFIRSENMGIVSRPAKKLLAS